MTEIEFFDSVEKSYRDMGMDVDIPSRIFLELNGEFISFKHLPPTMTYRFAVKEEQMNQFEQMHGGYINLLLDSIMGTLAHFESKPCVTSQLNTSFLNPVKEDHIVIQATIIGRRNRQTIVNGIARNDDGEIEANAQGTFIALA